MGNVTDFVLNWQVEASDYVLVCMNQSVRIAGSLHDILPSMCYAL